MTLSRFDNGFLSSGGWSAQSSPEILLILESIVVDAAPDVPFGSTYQFRAVGHFLGGITRNITARCTWTTDARPRVSAPRCCTVMST